MTANSHDAGNPLSCHLHEKARWLTWWKETEANGRERSSPDHIRYSHEAVHLKVNEVKTQAKPKVIVTLLWGNSWQQNFCTWAKRNVRLCSRNDINIVAVSVSFT